MSGLSGDYTTADELTYLKDLGTHRDAPTMPKGDGFPPRVSRVRLLQRYLRSLRYRHRWGVVDKGVCEEFARKLLADERVGE